MNIVPLSETILREPGEACPPHGRLSGFRGSGFRGREGATRLTWRPAPSWCRANAGRDEVEWILRGRRKSADKNSVALHFLPQKFVVPATIKKDPNSTNANKNMKPVSF